MMKFRCMVCGDKKCAEIADGLVLCSKCEKKGHGKNWGEKQSEAFDNG